MRDLLGHPRVCAVGKVGLDATLGGRQLQEEVFAFGLRVAVEMDKPLCLHVRGRKEAAMRIMKEVGVPSTHRIHMNGWTDSWEECQVGSSLFLRCSITYYYYKYYV